MPTVLLLPQLLLLLFLRVAEAALLGMALTVGIRERETRDVP